MNLEQNIDILIKNYNALVECTKLLTLPASLQIKKFEHWDVCYELADEFCEKGVRSANLLFENEWITRDQMNLISQIEQDFDSMSDEKSLWDDRALCFSTEWEEIRVKSGTLLNSLV